MAKAFCDPSITELLSQTEEHTGSVGQRSTNKRNKKIPVDPSYLIPRTQVVKERNMCTMAHPGSPTSTGTRNCGRLGRGVFTEVCTRIPPPLLPCWQYRRTQCYLASRGLKSLSYFLISYSNITFLIKIKILRGKPTHRC